MMTPTDPAERVLMRRHQPLARFRILIVEDASYAISLAQLLLRWGAQVVEVCTNGPHARHMLGRASLDAAILDYTLATSETGADIAQWIRAYQPHVARIAHSAIEERTLLDMIHPERLVLDARGEPLFHTLITKPASSQTLVLALLQRRPV
jgi:CheY-like chemotaxis protein